MDQLLELSNGKYKLEEVVNYPNGGMSYFYALNDTVIIIDCDICKGSKGEQRFPYSLITDKQNGYVKRYKHVYRFLKEDINIIDDYINNLKTETQVDYVVHSMDRSNNAETSPLEFFFETNFANAYGRSSLKYLNKEYCINDDYGNNYFLDYVVKTKHGEIAVEENGVTVHHPQEIGIEKYRRQLLKQNTCMKWGMKLYRFSSEDCKFEDRIEDDIKEYFGTDTSDFEENGLLIDRKIQLYEHQEITLERMQESRKNGINTFLIVFPTASGKSKIVEEDIKIFAKEHVDAKILILAPNTNIISDWHDRVNTSLAELKGNITINTFAYMSLHYKDITQDYYDYIVIDEAHHAVAPVLKRVIQYFTPSFMVGLTATDKRPDKKKLETVFGTYKTGLSLAEAMEKKIVAQANVYRIETNIDLSKVRFNGKDYINADLEKGIRVTSRNELIVDVLKEYFTDGDLNKKQGLIFCVNTQHTLEMEKLMNEAGISAKSYTGKSKSPEKIMTAFKNKEIRFLCVCEMISEGWDYPELGILVMARPTLSKVLYLQQIGRGLRKTSTKENVYVIDVVDEYGAMARPCTMHSIFHNELYVPFGNILNRNYHVGDMIEIDGLHETVEKIVEVNINNFEEEYGDYLSTEQLAREFYMSTGSITSWIKNGKITPSVSFPFGSKLVHLFSPADVLKLKRDLNIKDHTDETIKEDFFDFLEERDYSLSYKMPFMLAFIKNIDSIGDAKIDDVLKDYISFYQDRIDRGLQVDRATCPYNEVTLKDIQMIKRNMLTNPFEKFERKRFLYYSKDLSIISMNHSLFTKMSASDFDRVKEQMKDDLKNYYAGMGGI